jgi:hypothetical protein
MTRAWILLAVGLGPVGAVACNGVLGLNAPTLAECADGCSDAATSGPDVTPPGTDGAGAADGAVEAAAPDAGSNDGSPVCGDAIAPDSAAGIFCGGGCFGSTYCTGATPVCCQTTTGGVTSYACAASEAACTGYPIACADDDDCGGNDICCHFSSKITCDSTASCPSTGLVCRPSVADDCPSGKACDVPAVNAGVTSPYLLCAP